MTLRPDDQVIITCTLRLLEVGVAVLKRCPACERPHRMRILSCEEGGGGPTFVRLPCGLAVRFETTTPTLQAVGPCDGPQSGDVVLEMYDG